MKNVEGGLFSFRGRTRRSEWWLIGIGLGIAQLILMVIATALVAGWSDLASNLAQPRDLSTALVQLAIIVGFLWPIMALSVRRAHDRDGDGRWVFASFGLSMAASTLSLIPFFAEMAGMSLVLATLDGANLALSLFLLVTLGFLDGTKGPNRYGPSPKYSGGYQPMALD